MRQVFRSVVVLIAALIGAAAVGVISMLTAAVTLAATALIVPGTGTPNANMVGDYRENFRQYYFGTTPCTNGVNCPFNDQTGINYPASFFPLAFIPDWCVPGRCETWDDSVGEGVTNLNVELGPFLSDPDEEIVLAGYSQGARVVSIVLEGLADLPDEDKARTSAVLIGNISSPNGGLWTRLGPYIGYLPFFDVTFGNPTPTSIGIDTFQVIFEFDGVTDFPQYANPLAVLNALAGFQYVHGTYLAQNENSDPGELPNGYTPAELADQLNPALHPENFSTFGDTTYVFVPTRTLPIAQPFLEIAGATGTTALVKPIVDLVSPILRVLVNLGYDRSVSFGVPTPLSPLPFNPFINPVQLTVDLIAAALQGIQDATGGLDATTLIAPPTPAPLSETPTPMLAAARSAAVEPAAAPEVASLSNGAVEQDSDSLETTVDAVDATGNDVEEDPKNDEVDETKSDEAVETKTDEAVETKTDEAVETKTDESVETVETKTDEAVETATKDDDDTTDKTPSQGSVSLNFSPKESPGPQNSTDGPTEPAATDDAESEGAESEKAAA